MLRLTLFGTLALWSEGPERGARALHIGGRPGSLFALLALSPGRYFSRAELLSSIWSDSADEVSMGAVNTVLWRLRKVVERPPVALRGLIGCDRSGAVTLNPDVSVSLDVKEFLNLILPVLAKPLERTTETDARDLRRALAIYNAELLCDLNDEWVLREREKHRRHRLNALGRLMQVATLGRNYDEAISHGQAILDHDALREDMHRELMRLYLMSGQRALALRQFETCRNALRRELAIQPMRETMALYHDIVEHAICTDDACASQPARVSIDAMRASDDAGASRKVPLAHAQEHVEAARALLAQAERHLQLSLPFF
jgi:DNA-binding SARP family transcriptional activator